MPTDDMVEQKYVEGEESGAQQQSLRDTAGNSVAVWFGVSWGNKLSLVCEVWCEPGEECMSVRPKCGVCVVKEGLWSKVSKAAV